jgi:hypothetical protein
VPPEPALPPELPPLPDGFGVLSLPLQAATAMAKAETRRDPWPEKRRFESKVLKDYLPFAALATSLLE